MATTIPDPTLPTLGGVPVSTLAAEAEARIGRGEEISPLQETAMCEHAIARFGFRVVLGAVLAELAGEAVSEEIGRLNRKVLASALGTAGQVAL